MWNKIKEWFKNNKRNIVSCVCSMIIIYTTISIVMYRLGDLDTTEIEQITYTEFLELAENGKVDALYYSSGEETMTAVLFNEETKDMPLEEREEYVYENEDKRYVPYPAYDDFRKDMLSYDIRLILMRGKSTLVNVLSTLISLALPIFWIFLIWKMMSSQTKGLDKKGILQTSDVKFSDVIGQDEVIENIQFISDLIKDPTKGDNIGVKVPKGILLTGAPGTGKTLIAKAIAGEAGVPFISMGGSDFKELFVGMGAKRVRDLFKIARENAPCIIFIDEIDSIGAKRDSRTSNSEDDSTINALLKEMDGFNGREGIFVLAATNHPEKLDKALTRAGRFDRRIAINPPRDWQVRKELFEHYLENFKVSEDVDIDNLAKTVSGFTGADIAMICNEAGIVAMMHDKEFIDNASLEEAIDKVVFNGSRSKKEAFRKDKEIVAYHESGHAVMTYLVGKPISRASIIGTTSGVGGAVFQADSSDTLFTTKQDMIDRVMITYSGRASEEIKFKDVTTGAENDITQATNVMSAYIQRYGFDKDFGLLDISVLSEQGLIDMADITSRLSKMSKEVYKDTFDLLNKNYSKVEALAQKLLEVETLSGREIEELLNSMSSNNNTYNQVSSSTSAEQHLDNLLNNLI